MVDGVLVEDINGDGMPEVTLSNAAMAA